jgi:hypothetical protein
MRVTASSFRWKEGRGDGFADVFVSADCPRTRGQLESVPLAEDDEPNPGGQPSPRWEAQAGGLFAALRYACLFARSPSEEPEGGLRERLAWSLVEAEEDAQGRLRDYRWA